MKTIHVRLTFIEPVLGGTPSDPDIYRTYIASKAPERDLAEEEVAALGNIDEDEKGKNTKEDEKGPTVFPRTTDGTPFLWDYQIKGFFKDACGALREIPRTKSSYLTAYRKKIDKLIFPAPRRIAIRCEAGDAATGKCVRPLRTNTPKGERVSIARSEELPRWAVMEFAVRCHVDEHADTVREWLGYGCELGLGQWRNSGKGRFVWEELDAAGNVIGGNKADFDWAGYMGLPDEEDAPIRSAAE